MKKLSRREFFKVGAMAAAGAVLPKMEQSTEITELKPSEIRTIEVNVSPDFFDFETHYDFVVPPGFPNERFGLKKRVEHVPGKIFWLANDGDDQNSGLSPDDAKATIAGAIEEIERNGTPGKPTDVIFFM